MTDFVSGQTVDFAEPMLEVDIEQQGAVDDFFVLVGPGGPAGASGGVWFNGAGAPSSGTGAVGDWYINNTNQDVYKKTAVSTWTLQFNIKGAAGTNGTNGTNGAGVPTGGTTSQVLKKNSATNYDTGWLTLGSAATVDTGTASGNIPLLGSGGRLAVARLGSGTPDGTKFLRDDGTFVAPGASGAGALLAKVTRTATSTSSYSTSSSASADVDATNLAITFIPTTTAARITFEGAVLASGSGGCLVLSLRTGSTNIVGTGRGASEAGYIVRTRVSFDLTGLTVGTPVTYKLAFRSTNGTAYIFYGGSSANEFSGSAYYGPIYLEAHAA